MAILAAVCIATWIVSYLLDFPSIGIDDANIFLVYARNISAGEGFVFNAGGERVEGFTSLLWVLICSAVLILTNNPERWLLGLNVLLVSLTIGCCLRSFVFRRSSADPTISPSWAAAFLMLLLTDYRYVAWSTVALMETALWTSLVTLSALLIVDERNDRGKRAGLAALVGLMLLTRPEALMWAPAVLMLVMVMRAPCEGYSASLRLTRPAVLVFVFGTGLLTMFRLVYFGFPLPNTYYAKVSPSLVFRLREGGTYLWLYISSGPIPFAGAVAIVISTLHLIIVGARDIRTMVLCALAGVGLLIPALTGGDHFGGFRFYQPVYPVLLLALLNCVRFVLPRYAVLAAQWKFRRGWVLVGGATLTAIFLAVQIVDWVQFEQRLSMRMEFEIAQKGRERGSVAERLFADLRPRPSIGTITVGGLKHAYNGDVIDLMGLNNIRMAHNGGDRIGLRSHAAFEKRVFYEQKPTAVLPLVSYPDGLSCLQLRSPFVDLVLKGLLDDAAFHTAYRLAEVRRPTPEGFVALAAWYDREFLTRLAHREGFEIVTAQPRSEGLFTDCGLGSPPQSSTSGNPGR
ncbi:MAG TPA: hypothetical protein VJM31_13890 [Vicinamibacterales bacterium]|nr:hypothetical protein [Vicinamibacterales bacterium]